MLRGRGIPPPPPPPPAGALGRGRPLRGAASERVGVEVAELGLDVAFTGCLKASGEGVAGVRSLLGEGTEDGGRRDAVRVTSDYLQSLKAFTAFCLDFYNDVMINGIKYDAGSHTV